MTLGTLLAGATAALAVPITGSMGFGVTAAIDPGTPVVANDLVFWTGIPEILSTNATATVSDDLGLTGTVFGNGRGTWAADGNSGTVNLSFGWNSAGANRLLTNGSASNWSYTFTADQNSSFVMNYAVVGSGYTFGLWGFNLTHDLDSGIGEPVVNAFDPNSSGQFVGSLTAGQTYTVSLANPGNIFSEGGHLYLEGSAQGDFDWSIAPSSSVADSSTTFSLLGLALAALAGLRRRIRR